MQHSVYLDLMKIMTEVAEIYADALSGFYVHNLTTFDAHMLVALLDGKLHANGLARQMGRAATSFTPSIDKLERLGYVQRAPDPADRRAVWIELTSAGAELAAQMQVALEQAHAAIKQAFQQTETETSFRRFMLRYAPPTTALVMRQFERQPLVKP